MNENKKQLNPYQHATLNNFTQKPSINKHFRLLLLSFLTRTHPEILRKIEKPRKF